MALPRDKRDAMIEKLRQDFPAPHLIAVMIAVFKMRRKRAGLDPENFDPGSDLDAQLDEFMKSSSIR
jgi:hypothetical protein